MNIMNEFAISFDDAEAMKKAEERARRGEVLWPDATPMIDEDVLSTEPADQPVRVLTPAPRTDLIADHDEVFAAIEDESVRLIDVMPEAHYRGEMTMYARPGHIPSAVNVPVTNLVDETGHYRSVDELATMFDLDREMFDAKVGITEAARRYLQPLIRGEDYPPYVNGLPKYVALRNVSVAPQLKTKFMV